MVTRVRLASRAKGSTTKEILKVVGKTPVDITRSAAIPTPTTSATRCI